MSTRAGFFSATSTTQRRIARSEYASFFESPDQTGGKCQVFVAVATFTGSPFPSCGATKSSSSPEASDQYAIHFPSGDQTALRSRAPLVRVRFRVLPFSAGTVKTSPRAVRTARWPPGARAKSVIRSSTFTQRVRASFRSSGRSTDTLRLWPLFASRR